MVDMVCKIFNYNYVDLSSLEIPPHYIDVKASYCDTTTATKCTRKIKTMIRQNFEPKQPEIYAGRTLFHDETHKNLGAHTSSSKLSNGTYIKREEFNTACFDWDKVINGDDHVRGLAGEEIPALGFNNTWKVIEDNQDKVDVIVNAEQAALNNTTLAVFGLISASVVAYGVHSLYKRCTQKAPN